MGSAVDADSGPDRSGCFGVRCFVYSCITRSVGLQTWWRIFVWGGGTRPTPPILASVVHTFEAVAGSWGSVSAPAVSRVMGGAPRAIKKYR